MLDVRLNKICVFRLGIIYFTYSNYFLKFTISLTATVIIENFYLYKILYYSCNINLFIE